MQMAEPQASDPLTRLDTFSVSEAYEVVRTVLAVKGDNQYRLEVTRSASNANSPFDVHCYRLQKIGGDADGENVSAYVLVQEFSGAQDQTAYGALAFALTNLP